MTLTAAKVETYDYMSEIAESLGYPSILEALEDLERLKTAALEASHGMTEAITPEMIEAGARYMSDNGLGIMGNGYLEGLYTAMQSARPIDQQEAVSVCDDCGAEYPNAPPGHIHKCGRCEDGICSPERRGCSFCDNAATSTVSDDNDVFGVCADHEEAWRLNPGFTSPSDNDLPIAPVQDESWLTPDEEAEMVERINGNWYLQPNEPVQDDDAEWLRSLPRGSIIMDGALLRLKRVANRLERQP